MESRGADLRVEEGCGEQHLHILHEGRKHKMGKVTPTGSKGRGSTEEEGQITAKWSHKASMDHYFTLT